MKTHEISPRTQAVLDSIFNVHPANSDQGQRFDAINEKILQTARTLCTFTPESPEQTIMLRKLQEAKFYAIEAIAKNEKHSGF